VEFSEEDYLAHYGILRKSGRYPYGSGMTKDKMNRTFLDDVEEMRNKHGMSEAEIAKAFDITTTKLRDLKSIARLEVKQANINMALRLKDKGYSNVGIGKRMGVPEATVRSWLKPGELDKTKVVEATTAILKAQIAEKKHLDVGAGTEYHLGITRKKLDTAITALEQEGYKIHYVKVDQLGTNHQTNIKVLSAPGTDWPEVLRNQDNIKTVAAYSEDGGRSYDKIQPPLSIPSSRVAVRYAEEGGKDADGVIYVRPGVKDVSLGGANYAQVRVAVDGTHYLKGMAMYKDDLPAGVDLMFNTNKSYTGKKTDAMKPMKSDPENPFGSVVRQIGVPGPGGTKKITSSMNIVNEEGDWEKWANTLSSQMLSKQSPSLAKEQLGIAYDRKKNELDDIMGVTNPLLKKRLLEAYADDADSSAVHLKAAALPRQGTHIILPIESIKETEVFAPNFRDGELVVLVRHPHAGTFEIPELRVNNRHPEAKKLLDGAKDAIGIHPKVAEKLSGADFDGDTVLVIPNDSRKVKTSPSLEGLKDFDPQRRYPGYEGMVRMTPEQKGMEMGKISNLITDMQFHGATNDEMARAVRHSMVVIDAEKHNLDYKSSAVDNGILQLKKKYQKSGGASTVVSQAKSPVRPYERKLRIDPDTGKKVYEYTGATYQKTTTSKRTGVETTKDIRKLDRYQSTKLAETEDAHTLSSGTRIEKVYADHSNRMKALANMARKEALQTKPVPYSPAAKARYHEEVRTLDAKLNLALRNSPLERQAHVIGNAIVRQKQDANPGMDKAELKKLKSQALTIARNRVGAEKKRIEITDGEWEAIQAGAITSHKLNQILSNTDLDKVKERATPKTRLLMSEAKKTKALALLRNGYTRAQVADALGVSVSTLKRSLSGGDE
jgi:DNA-directed RNA polymerase specialized sigma24 family protein